MRIHRNESRPLPPSTISSHPYGGFSGHATLADEIDLLVATHWNSAYVSDRF